MLLSGQLEMVKLFFCLFVFVCCFLIGAPDGEQSGFCFPTDFVLITITE